MHHVNTKNWLAIWFRMFTLLCWIYYERHAQCVCVLTNRTLSGLQSPPRDYEIPGDGVSKIFTIIGASANLVFAFNTGMLPEIQVRQKLVNLHILCCSLIHNFLWFHMCSRNWVLFVCITCRQQLGNQLLRTWWKPCTFSLPLEFYHCTWLPLQDTGLMDLPQKCICWIVWMVQFGWRLLPTSQPFFNQSLHCMYVHLNYNSPYSWMCYLNYFPGLTILPVLLLQDFCKSNVRVFGY